MIKTRPVGRTNTRLSNRIVVLDHPSYEDHHHEGVVVYDLAYVAFIIKTNIFLIILPPFFYNLTS
ncbi:MAG: hypothetical protein K0R55_1324 [Sporomusa sp.]|jgi:hypothetical protein|nr:hypothetical protein [Sporomusa sp.]